MRILLPSQLPCMEEGGADSHRSGAKRSSAQSSGAQADTFEVLESIQNLVTRNYSLLSRAKENDSQECQEENESVLQVCTGCS